MPRWQGAWQGTIADMPVRRLFWIYLGLILAMPFGLAAWIFAFPAALGALGNAGLIALIAVPMTVLLLAFLDALRRMNAADVRIQDMAQIKAELEVSVRALQQRHRDLAASEQRYRGLVEAQGDVIIRRTPDGRLTFVNDAFCHVFGLSRDAVLGRSFMPEAHPEERLPLGALAGDKAMPRVRYDQRLKTRDAWRWFAWEDYVIRSESGHVTEIQNVGRDITEQKQLEAALREARDKAEQANKAKSMFLAMMSHEIRTPMNGVLGMAGLLLDTKLSPEQRNYAVAVRQSGEALLDIINDILDFSKAESGTLCLEETVFDPHALIESVAELLSPKAAEKGIEIVTYAHPRTFAQLLGDEGRIRQVLLNLTGNALKFTDSGGVRVTVGPDADPKAVRFEIVDSGIGITPEAQGKIFQVFVQADNSLARRFSGTGLGLAICERLVKAMGGEIGVTSVPGRGSRFWFTLPAKKAPGVEAPAEMSPLTGVRALILAQYTSLSEILTRELTEAGADAFAAKSLAAAETALASGGFDLFLCDHRLQGEGAEDIIARLKPKLGATRSIVLVPAFERGRLDALRVGGFDGYLIKPVRQASLIDRIRKVTMRISEVDHKPAAEPAEVAAAAASGAGLRVLMAEDNRINVLLATNLLQKMGHRVDTVGNGKEALEALSRAPYDLILMDVHMPEMDGLEATRRIRHAESTARKRGRRSDHIPIVALTANAMEGDRKICLDAGMDDFLTKPLDPRALREALTKHAGLALLAGERQRA